MKAGLQVRGSRARTLHFSTSKEEERVTEAVFNMKINCLQEISVRTFIGKNPDILIHPSFPLELFHYV